MIRKAALLAGALLALAVPQAYGTFSGQNGQIAFTGCEWFFDPPNSFPFDCEVWTVNADGSAPFNVTNGAFGEQPAWSPDGAKIAFRRGGDLWTVNPNGTAAAKVALPSGVIAADPAWSPDGTQLAFTRWEGSARHIYVANTDGSGMTALTAGPDTDVRPDWSPDGTKIAFSRNQVPWVMNANGTNQNAAGAPSGVTDVRWSPTGGRYAFSWNSDIWTASTAFQSFAQVTEWAEVDLAPIYSPDGLRIAYEQSISPPDEPSQVRIAAADASEDIVLQTRPHEVDPDWQPIPVNSYARPKGATPLRAALVIAYPQCTSPNRTHGPPLAFPSCNPTPGNSVPQSSPHVTVGTPDTNGAAAGFTGVARLDVVIGNPGTPADEADVAIGVSMPDIRCNPNSPAVCGQGNVSGPPDYSGELELDLTIRITDKDNTPSPGAPGAATTEDFNSRVPVQCAGTTTGNVGSTCSLATSYDAVVPGSVKEGERSVWQLGDVRIGDGGPDGLVSTPAGRATFARQGVQIP